MRWYLALLSVALFLAACSEPAGYYMVRPGDTLYSIAWKYGEKYQDVAGWNAIPPPYVIHQGKLLRIAPLSASRSDMPDKFVVAQPPARQAAPTRRSPVKPGSSNPANRAPELPAKIETPQKQRGPISWRWPADGKVIPRFERKTTGQRGIDIVGGSGEQIVAAADGRVVYAGSGLSGYGLLAIIKHNDLYLSAYAHNRQLMVKEGDMVKAGEQIGEMGSSGTKSTKLHFEIRRQGRPVNPLKYLPRK